MKLVTLTVGIVIAAVVGAAELSHERNVAKWQEVVRPSQSDQGAYWVWDYAANRSKFEWHVFQKAGEVHARLIDDGPEKPTIQPKFAAKAGRFREPTAFVQVDDGWSR